MTKVGIHVTVDPDLVQWLDQKVKEKTFASRSHAVNVALNELRKKEKVTVKF